jgi:hypothetical protein
MVDVKKITTGLLDAKGTPIVSEVKLKVPAIDNTPNVSEALEIKRSLRENLNSQAYDILSRTKEGQRATKKMSNIAQSASEEGLGNTLGREAQKEFIMANRDLGNILTTDAAGFSNYSKAVTKDPFSSMDAAFLAADPLVAAAKKGGDLAKNPAIQSTIGYGMQSDLGSNLLGAAGAYGAIKGKQSLQRKD